MYDAKMDVQVERMDLIDPYVLCLVQIHMRLLNPIS
jgi:hypothetical protein